MIRSRGGELYIEPGSPWQNPYVANFGSRIPDELLAVELFSCLADARVIVDDWRHHDNEHRPQHRGSSTDVDETPASPGSAAKWRAIDVAYLDQPSRDSRGQFSSRCEPTAGRFGGCGA